MICKYRLRWLSSKGAFLVLVWTLLITVACVSFVRSLDEHMMRIQRIIVPHDSLNWLRLIPLSTTFLLAPLSGWLADAKFGNYRVFMAGAVLLFSSTVLNSLLFIIEALVWESNYILMWIHISSAFTMFVIGSSMCIVTSLPLGLDQMPDASASNITSFIAWFVFNHLIGYFLDKLIRSVKNQCLDKTEPLSFSVVLSFLSTLCMSIVLVTHFLLPPNWLIIEPKSPQTMKIIYNVLKFAAKHKAPLNRSALTYWEEDIPSRIDLGKSRYGGPFTTEQVEDVKTVLHLLAISTQFTLLFLFLNGQPITSTVIFPGLNLCETDTVHLLTYSSQWFSLLGVVVYEFIVYPLLQNKLPSILRRIGAVSLMTTVLSFVCFILTLAHYLSHSNETTTVSIVSVLYQSTNGILLQLLLTFVLEFVCAQSPYNMRGLLVSFVVPVFLLTAAVGGTVPKYLTNTCKQSWCSLVSLSVKTIACLIGFLLYCIVARWYKIRVRDDGYFPQRVVEEVYDRYLTAAAAAQSKHQ